MKLLGAVLIFAAAAAAFIRHVADQRRYMKQLNAVASSLELLESLLRWKKIPAAKALASLTGRADCGGSYAKILKLLKSNNTLQSAWNNGFADMPQEICAVTSQVEWQGDEEKILSSLHGASTELRRLGEEQRRAMGQRRRLMGAAALCGAALLVIVLA